MARDLLLVAVRDGELVLVDEVAGVLVDRETGLELDLGRVVLLGLHELEPSAA